MKQIYVPYLRTKQGELLAWRDLSPSSRDRMLPAFALASGSNNANLETTLDKLIKSTGDAPFILDASLGEGAECTDSQSVNNDANDFEFWTTLCSKAPNCIPVVQTPAVANRLRIKRQAERLMETHGKVALRFRIGIDQISRKDNVLLGLSNPENCIFIIDLHDTSSRGSVGAYFSRIDTIIKGVSEISPAGKIVLIGNNYPTSLKDINPVSGSIRIDQIDIWQQFSNQGVVYGDYAAIRTSFPSGQLSAGPPQICMPIGEEWHFERRDNAPQNQLADCARALLQRAGWPPALAGVPYMQQLTQAAAGQLDGRGNASAWTKIRCGMHMESMVDFLSTKASTP